MPQVGVIAGKATPHGLQAFICPQSPFDLLAALAQDTDCLSGLTQYRSETPRCSLSSTYSCICPRQHFK